MRRATARKSRLHERDLCVLREMFPQDAILDLFGVESTP
jgi:hypothetical protein